MIFYAAVEMIYSYSIISQSSSRSSSSPSTSGSTIAALISLSFRYPIKLCTCHCGPRDTNISWAFCVSPHCHALRCHHCRCHHHLCRYYLSPSLSLYGGIVILLGCSGGDGHHCCRCGK